jgi:hypothetical protein
LPTDQSKVHAPGWIIACAGLVFVLSGAAVINGYALSKNTALYSSAIQYFLGMGIVGLMLIICGWVAFGPGERHFTVSSTFSTAAPTSERSGRIVFGIGFLMIFALFANGIISSIKKKIK